MARRFLSFVGLIWFAFGNSTAGNAQDDTTSQIRVNVVLVQLGIAVTDSKGNYISNLRPQDFQIVEDGIPQRTSTFEEGNEPVRKLTYAAGSNIPTI